MNNLFILLVENKKFINLQSGDTNKIIHIIYNITSQMIEIIIIIIFLFTMKGEIIIINDLINNNDYTSIYINIYYVNDECFCFNASNLDRFIFIQILPSL